MPRAEMTARIVRAVRNPRVTMLGHPTGRLLLARDGYAVDLDATHCRRARARGVTIVINPDAHATDGLADLDYGIGVARRAGLGPDDVFNTAPAEAIARAFQARRRARKR